jgi:uracil-DNA glycosylase
MPALMIIGQAPSRTSDPGEVLRGKSGEKLRELLGFSLRKFVKVERVNLAPFWTGKEGKGDAFEADPDLVATALAIAQAHKTTLVLGKAAAAAIGLPAGVDYFVPLNRGRTTFYVIPHTSGINRWWNDRANRKDAERFFGRLTWRSMRRIKSLQT